MSQRVETGDEGDVGVFPGVTLDPSISLSWRDHIKKRTQQRATPIDLNLPSGLPVRAMRIPVRALIQYGVVPDPLTPIIREHADLLETKDGNANAERMISQFEEDPEKTWLQWMSVLRAIWIACVTQPTFTDDVSKVNDEGGPYDVAEVDYFDMLYVYQWAQGVDESVAEFLHEQTQIMGNMANGQSVRDEAERVLRIDRRGGRVVRAVGGSGDVDMGDDGRAVAERDGRLRRSKATEERAAHQPEGEVHAGADQSADLRPAPNRHTRRAAASRAK